MGRSNRVPRSKDDLKQELRDQLDILRMACSAYDGGTEAAGKTIAGILRVLLYSHKQSRGLLDQLEHRSSRFISSAGELTEENLASTASLLVITVTETTVKWRPKLHVDPHCKNSKKLSYPDWWSETVVIDSKGVSFSRMQLVMHVADTDGGSHVDPGLVESYMNLTRANSLGLEFGEVKSPFLGRPVLACMRQIAQEVIATLFVNVPELGEHVVPIIPPADVFPPSVAGKGQCISVAATIPEQYRGVEGLTVTATLERLRRIE